MGYSLGTPKDVWAQIVPRNTSNPLDTKHTFSRNALPLVNGLSGDAEISGEGLNAPHAGGGIHDDLRIG